MTRSHSQPPPPQFLFGANCYCRLYCGIVLMHYIGLFGVCWSSSIKQVLGILWGSPSASDPRAKNTGQRATKGTVLTSQSLSPWCDCRRSGSTLASWRWQDINVGNPLWRRVLFSMSLCSAAYRRIRFAGNLRRTAEHRAWSTASCNDNLTERL